MPNLVGIGNSQVPTNAMLGGLAYQDSVGEITIDKIKTRTSDTAKDIFVYDTSKDSDGGAWRHRTQNTSWYNEGASSIRGARKEFPAVAIIVVETSQVTIYDADDPNCPMWMVFNQSMIQLGAMVGYTSFSIGCCTMVNGILMVGMDASNQGNVAGLRLINFISEHFNWKANITGRHSSQSWPIIDRNGGRSNVNIDSNLIINEVINDVDAIVLPNAQIDTSTGLPTPTIVIGTNGGISVITDSGVVYDLTTNNEADDIAEIAFLSDNRYAFATTANNERWWVDDIQTADENSNYFYQRTSYDYSQGSQGSISPLGRNNGTSRGEVGEAIFRQASGMSRIRYVDTLINYTTTDYNTGWMHGNVKRALLSSSDSTDLDRTNILGSLGTFASASGWSLQGAGAFSISGGKLNGNGTSGDSFCQRAETPAVITSGTTYTVKFTVTRTSGDVRARVGGSSYGPTVNASGTYWHEITAGSIPTETILFYGNSFNGTVDDVELYIQDQDRSQSNTGMTVVGTVPRSPVADGAELMAYGPFNNGYLQQAYSSDLDYGTDDFYYMIWINLSSHNPLQGIWSRQDQSQGSGNRIQFQTVGNDNGKLAIYSGVNMGNFGDNSACQIGVWHHIAMVRRSGTMYWYKDGVQFSSYSDTTNYTNSNALLRLGGLNLGSSGQEYTTNNYGMTQGKLALFRTGSTGPSEKEIKKIYNDEKYLFRDNAKCTLHGTSNDVTALAYDDTKNILHAGTSSGRSEFQGLTRINNTTTAVTTAISASNGLVAEQ